MWRTPTPGNIWPNSCMATAAATEHRLLMAATKSLVSVLLALAVCAFAQGQDAGQPPGQTSAPSSAPPSSTPPSSVTPSSATSSSSSHRSIHHIRVPEDDSPGQPPELNQAEAAIEKQN